jgi:16S rRNA (cytosine967-C5)-methyltransferase
MPIRSLETDLSPSGPPVSQDSRGVRVRGLAARVNAAVVARGESLDRALEGLALEDLRDMSLLRAIAFGSVRWHHRLQWQAEQLLSRPLKRADTELAALLRVGLFQLQWLRIPDHAAVAATVDAATFIGASRGKGLVNAVLRRFLRDREALEKRMQADRQALASHPRWLLDLFARDWPEQAGAIIAANNRLPPMWLRVNIRKTSRADYLQQLTEAGIAAEAADGDGTAIVLAEPCATSSLPGYAAGLVSVQDGAAQRAAALLAPKLDQRVLDACAAPGGKAAHLLETYPGVAELVALDRDPHRLSVVEDNFARLGLAGTTLVGDAAEPASWWDGRPFERILLDAPCSALGVIRRHPDIKVLRRPEDIHAVARRQAQLLRSLWPLLAPGGRLLYATCTIAREENQVQIADFLAATADAESATTAPGAGRQILPGEANMDGFYYACLDKR